MHRCTLPLSAFVDSNFAQWLLPLELPATLRRDLVGFTLPWESPVSTLFGAGLPHFETALADAIASTNNTSNAYHNMQHAQRVVDNGDDALQIIQAHIGVLPQEFLLAILYALATHDKGHPGATFFALAKEVPAELDNPAITPVEWYTACLADDMMRHAGFSLLARLVAAYIIISSAYGAHTPHGKRMQLIHVQPKAILGCLMRACDVTPPAEHSVAINDETAVLYQETPAMPAPTSWRGYLAERREFLDYVQNTHDKLDQALQQHMAYPGQFSLVSQLGWQGVLDKSVRTLSAISSGTAPAKAAILRARLRTLGVPLD